MRVFPVFSTLPDTLAPGSLLGLAWLTINTAIPLPVHTPVTKVMQQGIPGMFRYVPCLPSHPTDTAQALSLTPRPSVTMDRGHRNGFYTFGGLDATKAGVQESPCVAPPPLPRARTNVSHHHSITYTPLDNTQGF